MASITLPDEASYSPCLCICICIWVSMYLCVQANRAYAYVHVCILFVSAYKHTFIHSHIHMCVCPLYFLSDHRNVHGQHAHSFQWHTSCLSILQVNSTPARWKEKEWAEQEGNGGQQGKKCKQLKVAETTGTRYNQIFTLFESELQASS